MRSAATRARVARLLWAGLGCGLAGWTAPAAPAAAQSVLHSSGPRMDPALVRVVAGLPPASTCAVWVQLPSPQVPASVAQARALVSARAWDRRGRRGSLVPDSGDAELEDQTVQEIRARVTRLRATSRWLRTVSVEATADQVTALRQLPGILALDLLAAPELLHRTAPPAAATSPAGRQVAAPPYGDAAAQLALLRVPELHDRGLTGLGVLIAHLDTGYERFTHQAFRALRIAAMHDFVDGDGDPTGARGFLDDAGTHGSMTLSVLGGFRPGALVGAAFGAAFALARTEREFTEDAFEEDFWIAALEWADSLGADVVSSSLKFRENDDGGGYTWQDMDGQTARVSRATRFAESRGILVVNGAGNDGASPFHNTLVAPADAEYVLAVGATNLGGERAHFSSCGPTTGVPERIKPDVMAPGDNVWAMSVENDSAYARTSGTSFSTPLAAGVAALLLSVHDATPAELRTILRSTASRADSPGNEWGWGIVNALAAYQALVARFPADTPAAVVEIDPPRFANPFRPRDVIEAAVGGPRMFSLHVYDVTGRAVRTWAGRSSTSGRVRIVWDATDERGRLLPRGVYFVELRAGRGTTAVRKLTLTGRP